MTVIKINAITVAADSGDELAQRFAARAGAVDGQAGFEGFELLQPTDDRTTWLVITRWTDEGSFQAWVNSPAFGHGHRSEAQRSGGAGSTDGASAAHGAHAAPANVGVSSELWSYAIAGGTGA
ncbi:MAG: antibiotic biosynthesis monooxygenase [Salinibacterium sp.]|nr:antibiotic biosynthesis monooxygenase [Salinibacterium sp.]